MTNSSSATQSDSEELASLIRRQNHSNQNSNYNSDAEDSFPIQKKSNDDPFPITPLKDIMMNSSNMATDDNSHNQDEGINTKNGASIQQLELSPTRPIRNHEVVKEIIVEKNSQHDKNLNEQQHSTVSKEQLQEKSRTGGLISTRMPSASETLDVSHCVENLILETPNKAKIENESCVYIDHQKTQQQNHLASAEKSSITQQQEEVATPKVHDASNFITIETHTTSRPPLPPATPHSMRKMVGSTNNAIQQSSNYETPLSEEAVVIVDNNETENTENVEDDTGEEGYKPKEEQVAKLQSISSKVSTSFKNKLKHLQTLDTHSFYVCRIPDN